MGYEILLLGSTINRAALKVNGAYEVRECSICYNQRMNKKGFSAMAVVLVVTVVLTAGGIWYFESYKSPDSAPTFARGAGVSGTVSSATSNSATDIDRVGGHIDWRRIIFASSD
jgi:hypothetical protein